MTQVQPIRPGMATAVDPAATRVLLITEPSTLNAFTADATHRGYALILDSGGIEAVDADAPELRRAQAIIVEVDPANAVMFDAFESFVRDHAERVPVVAAVRDLTVAATRRVLRAGAADIVPLPFGVDDLDRAVEPARDQLRNARGAKAAKRGKIVAFLGAIGGVGTTSIAVQSGILWSAGASVCLLDLDLQFGNAALYCDLRPKLSIADVIDAGDRLDGELLQTTVEKHSSGLSILACPHDLLPLDTLTMELIEKLATLAAETYDIVIVDLPAAWTNWSLRTVELADVTILVTSLTVPGIHQAKRQIEIIEANGIGDRLQLLINRVVQPMFGKIDLSETQALLGRRIDYAIANDYPTVSAAIDRGKSFATVKSRTRVEKDLRAVVAALTERFAAKAIAA